MGDVECIVVVDAKRFVGVRRGICRRSVDWVDRSKLFMFKSVHCQAMISKARAGVVEDIKTDLRGGVLCEECKFSERKGKQKQEANQADTLYPMSKHVREGGCQETSGDG